MKNEDEDSLPSAAFNTKGATKEKDNSSEHVKLVSIYRSQKNISSRKTAKAHTTITGTGTATNTNTVSSSNSNNSNSSSAAKKSKPKHNNYSLLLEAEKFLQQNKQNGRRRTTASLFAGVVSEEDEVKRAIEASDRLNKEEAEMRAIEEQIRKDNEREKKLNESKEALRQMMLDQYKESSSEVKKRWKDEQLKPNYTLTIFKRPIFMSHLQDYSNSMAQVQAQLKQSQRKRKLDARSACSLPLESLSMPSNDIHRESTQQRESLDKNETMSAPTNQSKTIVTQASIHSDNYKYNAKAHPIVQLQHNSFNGNSHPNVIQRTSSNTNEISIEEEIVDIMRTESDYDDDNVILLNLNSPPIELPSDNKATDSKKKLVLPLHNKSLPIPSFASSGAPSSSEECMYVTDKLPHHESYPNGDDQKETENRNNKEGNPNKHKDKDNEEDNKDKDKPKKKRKRKGELN